MYSEKVTMARWSNRSTFAPNINNNRNFKQNFVGPPYTCITCDASYKTHEELKQHKIETKHKKSLKYNCEHCERKYDTFCKFEEHVRTHTGEKPNKCATCGKCFNFKTDLKRHMVMHMEVKPYLCRFCNKGVCKRITTKCPDNSVCSNIQFSF